MLALLKSLEGSDITAPRFQLSEFDSPYVQDHLVPYLQEKAKTKSDQENVSGDLTKLQKITKNNKFAIIEATITTAAPALSDLTAENIIRIESKQNISMCFLLIWNPSEYEKRTFKRNAKTRNNPVDLANGKPIMVRPSNGKTARTINIASTYIFIGVLS